MCIICGYKFSMICNENNTVTIVVNKNNTRTRNNNKTNKNLLIQFPSYESNVHYSYALKELSCLPTSCVTH